MTRADLHHTLGGTKQKVLNVWETPNGARPMTPLEIKMYSLLCSLTGTDL